MEAKRRQKTRPPRVSARKKNESRTVKSVARTMEVLEYFDDVQKKLTVMEVATALKYPASSTSSILRSLANLGYLEYDAYDRTYFPASRVALLGSWVNSGFFAEGAIISMMKQLSEQTGDTILLAVRNGLYAQYIHIIQSTRAEGIHLSLGTARYLTRCGAGYVLLSMLPDSEVARLVRRINAEDKSGKALVKPSELLEQLSLIRENEYALTCDLVRKGAALIATPLPQSEGQSLKVVGIGGFSEDMKSNEHKLAQILRQAIQQHF